MTLKDVFPILFGIARTKDDLVEAHMELSGGVIQWNVRFAIAA
jgi:hypothetical protein